MRTMLAVSVTSALLILAACSKNRFPEGPTPEQIARNSAGLVAYLDAEYEEELLESPRKP